MMVVRRIMKFRSVSTLSAPTKAKKENSLFLQETDMRNRLVTFKRLGEANSEVDQAFIPFTKAK